MHPNAVKFFFSFFGRGRICAQLAHGLQFCTQKPPKNALFAMQKSGARLAGAN